MRLQKALDACHGFCGVIDAVNEENTPGRRGGSLCGMGRRWHKNLQQTAKGDPADRDGQEWWDHG